jgi:hypothetical protein
VSEEDTIEAAYASALGGLFQSIFNNIVVGDKDLVGAADRFGHDLDVLRTWRSNALAIVAGKRTAHMTTLKTIMIQGFGHYVCGRKKSEGNAFPRFDASAPQLFNDADAIRAAAKSLNPIYAAAENIDFNQTYGDCTAAAAIKMQAIFDCAAPRTWRMPTPEDALWIYSQTTNPPFNPATGANDNGADLQTVLAFWQKNGLYKDGHGKIKTAYAVDATNKSEVIAALDKCGILYAGCDLADLWEKITGTGFVWPMAGPPDPQAGHCTYIYGHNDTGVFVGSWGMEGTIPWDALAYYFGAQAGGELYAVVAA